MARPFSVVIDCRDPEALAAFWAPALNYSDVGWPADNYVVLASERGPDMPLLLLQKVDEPKQGKNRVHIDVYSRDIEAEADRLVSLGATRETKAGEPISEHGASWIVMADPEGNEFCVCRDLT
jgi:predicted enzyme related to lactoylglutathione lyase